MASKPACGLLLFGPRVTDALKAPVRTPSANSWIAKRPRLFNAPPGTIFVEAFGTRHHGMNAGSVPAKVLFIDHSEEGQSNVVKTEAPGPSR